MTTNLRIPWPLSVNSVYTPVKMKRGVRMRLSNNGREWYKRCAAEVLTQLGGRPKPYEGRVGWSMVLHAPDNRQRDISNHIKIVEDALTKCGVWKDDKQVDFLELMRGEVCPRNGHAIITVYALDS